MKTIMEQFEWIIDIIENEEKIEKPSIMVLRNSKLASDILKKHLILGNKIKVHCDVDVDGTFSGRLFYKVVKLLKSKSKLDYRINKNKKHGIKGIGIPKESEELVVILDSSSNDIKEIREMECDVIVIDHHEVTVDINDLVGSTKNGTYVIVNNMVSDEAQNEMSACQVLYEFIRYMIHTHSNINLTESDLRDAGLESIVAVTLFSDMIKLNNIRNQYYIQQLIEYNKEPDLRELVERNEFNCLSKKYINYEIAPLINSTIRGGNPMKALNISVLNLKEIKELEKYREMQSEIVKKSMNNAFVYDDYITCECLPDIPREYYGVIAAKLGGRYGKNSYVYSNNNGLIEGSFRGTGAGNYRKACEDAGATAAGHREAFGLEVNQENLYNVLNISSKVETKNNIVRIGKGGNVKKFDELKRERWLHKIGLVNSRLSPSEAIKIRYDHKPEFIGMKGSAYKYSLEGLTCTAFNEIESDSVMIYLEKQNKSEIFLENIE